MQQILDHAELTVKEYDPNFNTRHYLKEKIESQHTRVVYFQNEAQVPVGICIKESLSLSYGNLIIHTINAHDQDRFAKLLAEDGCLKGLVLELIQFRSGFEFMDRLIQLGYREKERVRMLHSHLAQYATITPMPNLTFRELTVEDNDTCGKISHLAHQHRTHIECYDVYASPESRREFSDEFRKNKHGISIRTACLLMLYNQTPIGIIEVVRNENWGKTIGWIMDIAVLPDYHGMGLGHHLLSKCLSALHHQGYEYAGLAVTLTNKNAHDLYLSMGFENEQYFVEIIG